MHPSVFADSQCQFAVSLTATKHGGQPDGHQRGAGPVHAPGHANRRLGDEEVRRDGREDHRDQRQPEEVVKGEVVDDRPGQHHAGASADAEQRRHQADRGRHAFARELVPDDPERQREDPAGRTLDHAPDEHQRERCRKRRHKRADGQEREHDHQQPLFPVHVAEPADQRCRNRGAQEVRRQDPADGVLRRVQRVLDVGQSRRDKRLQQCIGDPAQREDEKREAWMLAVGLGGHASKVAGKRQLPSH